jgi:membrane protein
MHAKHFIRLAKQAINAWLDDYAPSMGAAIAFYTVFSLAPLVIIVIAVAGFFGGHDAVQGQLFGQVGAMVGPEGAKAVQSVVQGAQAPRQGLVATLISLGVLVVGSTTVFSELQSALDRIWKVPAAQKPSGIWNMLRTRLLSFGLILALAFLLIVSLIVSAVLAALGSWASGLLPAWEILLQVSNIVVGLVFTTVLFAMIYRFMPNASVAWRDVWTGAGVTAVLFEIGKVLIGLYIGKASIASSYTAAGSLVVVLIWVYYAAQVFLLGAEFTWVYANQHGSRRGDEIHPSASVHRGSFDDLHSSASIKKP